MKVLIVEDTLPAALGAKAVLGAFKADVSIADSGKKALELAVQPFDIILMDIGLPDTDGFKLTREIHEKCPANTKTNIVALTAHTDTSYKEKAKEYGLVGVINKPLTIENFTEMLQTLSMS